jgi:two-component system chemotaxis response regulator CheY
MTMEDIITWLCNIEDLACNFYKRAADRFKEDPVLADFLHQLAEDEAQHSQLLASVRDLSRDKEESPQFAVIVDAATRERVEKPVRDCLAKVLDGDWTPTALLSNIVKAEFSEWNDIFLYVMTTCQQDSKTLQHIAATVQAHQNRIEKYLDGLPDHLRPPQHVRDLPKVWEHTFLVVEDESVIRILWERLLHRRGKVESANNGRKGLEKTNRSFFDVIITDIDMPVMNGLEFFRQATLHNKGLRKHLVFCTGNVSPEVAEVASSNQIPLLPKPFTIEQMFETVGSALREQESHLQIPSIYGGLEARGSSIKIQMGR